MATPEPASSGEAPKRSRRPLLLVTAIVVVVVLGGGAVLVLTSGSDGLDTSAAADSIAELAEDASTADLEEMEQCPINADAQLGNAAEILHSREKDVDRIFDALDVGELHAYQAAKEDSEMRLIQCSTNGDGGGSVIVAGVVEDDDIDAWMQWSTDVDPPEDRKPVPVVEGDSFRGGHFFLLDRKDDDDDPDTTEGGDDDDEDDDAEPADDLQLPRGAGIGWSDGELAVAYSVYVVSDKTELTTEDAQAALEAVLPDVVEQLAEA